MVELYVFLSSASAVDGVTVATRNLRSGETLEGFKTTSVNEIQQYANFKQISSQTTTVAGKPAYKIVWQATVPTKMPGGGTQNIEIKTIQIYTTNNNIAYVLGYKATSSEYDTHLAQAQQIIDSFKFI